MGVRYRAVCLWSPRGDRSRGTVCRSRGRDRVPQSRAGQGAAVAGRDGGYCEPEYSGGRQCFSSQV